MSDNENEQSFNEDELKDIMDEIESLEEDFGAAESDATLDEAKEDAPSGEDMSLESHTDTEPNTGTEPHTDVEAPVEPNAVLDEVESESSSDFPHLEQDEDPSQAIGEDTDVITDSGEEIVSAEVHDDNIVELNSSPQGVKDSGSAVDFSANGHMNLAMNFEFNGARSKIILESGCVKIDLPGVHVVFDEKDGCQISADNGMTFQLPLDAKKAS